MFSKVQDSALKLYVKAQILFSDERDQDLIEYALLAALIALGATLGMKSLATGINKMFDSVNTALTTA
jgi:pilus assembly protein Flp/PilA